MSLAKFYLGKIGGHAFYTIIHKKISRMLLVRRKWIESIMRDKAGIKRLETPEQLTGTSLLHSEEPVNDTLDEDSYQLLL